MGEIAVATPPGAPVMGWVRGVFSSIFGAVSRVFSAVVGKVQGVVARVTTAVPGLNLAAGGIQALWMTSANRRRNLYGRMESAGARVRSWVRTGADWLATLLAMPFGVLFDVDPIRGFIRKVLKVLSAPVHAPFFVVERLGTILYHADWFMGSGTTKVTNITFGIAGTGLLTAFVLGLFGVALGPAVPILLGVCGISLAACYMVGGAQAGLKYWPIAQQAHDEHWSAEKKWAAYWQDIKPQPVALRAVEPVEGDIIPPARKEEVPVELEKINRLRQMMKDKPGLFTTFIGVQDGQKINLARHITVQGFAEYWLVTINNHPFTVTTHNDEMKLWIKSEKLDKEHLLFDEEWIAKKLSDQLGYAQRVSAQ